MIIEYEHPEIVTQINDAIAEGRDAGRPVKRIKLDQREWANFHYWIAEQNPGFYCGQRSFIYRGVTIAPQT